MRPDGIVIAIDGPSGAGKSTVARRLADRLGYVQIDTGAMYRATALLINRAEIDLTDQDALSEFCRKLEIRLENNNGIQIVIANGIDVSAQIRTPEISMLTSRIAALKTVRDAMLTSQRRMGDKGGVVLEGRDIGTVVFPDAELKFYLIASTEERARRRYDELIARGENINFEETVADVRRRDAQDSERDIAPMRQAEDAIEVDSSFMNIDDVLELMEKIYREKIKPSGDAL